MRRLLRQLVSPESMEAKGGGGFALPEELALLTSYSMAGLQVLEKLYVLGRDVVARNISGDWVECGVCNGGSAAAIACAFRDTDRKGWLYDSFMGMPSTREVDGRAADQYIGACVGSEDKVREALRIVHYSENNYIIRRGHFKDTFRDPTPQTISFLHVDADWYDSVILSLKTFYDLVAEGGVIVLDDFGHWEGCREAFYDFVKQRGLKPLLERFGHTQAFWVKGRMHNREFVGRREIP